MEAGGLKDQAIPEVCKINGSLGEGKEDSQVIKVLLNFPSHSIQSYVWIDSHSPGCC